MKKTKKPEKQSQNEPFEFRIIAGTLKGRVIKAPNLGVTRPPLSRLRKSIFDFLKPYLEDANYLDLFSGTGSYLFEAVSRGVKTATGVELEQALVESTTKHAVKFQIEDRLICLCEDVFQAIPRLSKQNKKFDIVMIAPPQYKKIINDTLQVLRENKIISDDHMVLCQHDTSENKDLKFDGYEVVQQRKYGNTTFTILKLDS